MIILPLLLIFLLFYFVFRHPDFNGNQISTTNDRSPVEILKQRYAEGALSQEEFLRMREELSKNT